MPTTTDLAKIEPLTRNFASRRQILQDRIEALEDEVRAVHRRKIRGIKSALAVCQDIQADLTAEIERHPELFKKPRTLTIEGIKVGYTKQKGKITFDDAEKVCQLIKKKLSDQSDVLIKVTEAPVKSALSNLSAAELKSIGCNVIEAGDLIVIKPQDSELDKLLAKIMEIDAADQEADT